MTEIKKLENSQIEFEASVEASLFEKYYKKVLESAVKDAELPGFRKGKAPEKMVKDKIGESYLLEEAANKAISDKYPSLIEENKISPISSPEISITKIALGNPLEFKVKVTVMPEFELPEYKKIATEVNKKKTDPKDIEVTDKEVDDVLLQIRAANLSPDDKESKKEPPALTDEMAKQLGDFNTVEELTNKIRENIKEEKTVRARDKKRVEMVEEIIKKTPMEVPEVLIESELNRMTAQFEGDIANMGLKKEDYLKRIKKTEEDLKKEWRPDAQNRAKLQLILNKIAVKEDLSPDPEKVKREIEHLIMHYKDADPERVKTYVETVLLNEKVFELLESQK